MKNNKNIVALSGGGYFNLEKAEEFNDAEDWDGRNNISRATGSQWSNQTLYRTAQGNWVLYHRSRESGVPSSHQRLEEREAAEWLLVNNHAKACEQYLPKCFGEMEV